MSWLPTAQRKALSIRAHNSERIRHFFSQQRVMEVETPLLGLTVLADAQSQAVAADGGYLQVSSISYLQRLLAAGSGDVFQMSRVFRKVSRQVDKQTELSALEWCRQGYDLWAMMEEVANLLEPLLACRDFDYCSYAAIFEQFLGIHPVDATIEQLRFEAGQHVNVEIPKASKEDWLELLFNYLIVPALGKNKPLFIYDYPPEQAGLAKIDSNEMGVPIAEKFTLFYRGLQLAEGLSPQNDIEAAQLVMQKENQKRAEKGWRVMPMDGDYLQAVAYGVPANTYALVQLDALVMVQLGASRIQDAISFVRP